MEEHVLPYGSQVAFVLWDTAGIDLGLGRTGVLDPARDVGRAAPVWWGIERQETTAVGVTADDDELTVELRAGLRCVINRMWRIGLYGRSTWIDDRIADEDKRQNTVTLRLAWNWDVME